MKKLVAVMLGLALATAAHATNPTVHISADGPALQSTSDRDTLHISITGNTNLETIGILWFTIAAPPQLKLRFQTVADRRYEPDVFWAVNPTDNSRDSCCVDGYGRTVYLITMNSYFPPDSCTGHANVSGRIGRIEVGLAQPPGGDANYSVTLGFANTTLPGFAAPPAVPWAQLCSLANATYQPGIDFDNNTVTISALGGGGGGGCSGPHCIDPIRALRMGKPVEWYDVAGRKLVAKPTGRGVYFLRLAGSETKRVVVL